ncbi:MAG TPA: hypothetical protein VL093_08065 [Flavipsychrobacter sp.]|nr:hypothetical protein [Flavipsychrobacter sp.]
MKIDDPNDTSEGGDITEFIRWSEFYKKRAAYDAPSDSSVLEPANKGFKYYLKTNSQYCNDNVSYRGNWKCVGPFNNYYGNTTEHAGR